MEVYARAGERSVDWRSLRLRQEMVNMLDTKRNALLNQVAKLVVERTNIHQAGLGMGVDPERNARLKQIEHELATLWEAIRRMPREVRNGCD